MNLLDYGSSSDDETESSSLTQQKPPHSYTHKSASFSTTTIETTPLDAKKHSEFVKKSREFDLTHEVLPEEVTVHHLDMPHESDGHHYLRGHKDSSSGSGSGSGSNSGSGSGSNGTSDGHDSTSTSPKRVKLKLPSAEDLLSHGKSNNPEKHSEFVKKSREFDLTHEVLPEEVTVHHLDMPHESDGHHYLRGHKDSSSGSGSSTTSKPPAKKKMKLPSAADLLSGGKSTVQFSVSVSSTSTSTSTKQSGSVKSPEAKLSSEFLCCLYVIYSLRYSFPYHTLIH